MSSNFSLAFESNINYRIGAGGSLIIFLKIIESIACVMLSRNPKEPELFIEK